MRSLIPLIMSLIAGLSTVIGAFILFLSKEKNNRLITFSLAYSAGVMITVSFTDLFASAEEVLTKAHGSLKGIILSCLFLLIGSLLAYLIDEFIPDDPKGSINRYTNSNEKLYRVGLVSMIALIIHNFPEGVATFISGYQNTSLGIYVTLAIALHNIPEGITIAMPIYYSTRSKKQAFKYTLYSGLAEPLGALVAFLFLRPYISEVILAITFALVAGIMLYIAFAELIPTARIYKHNKVYLFSIFLGILTIVVSHMYSH
ncbi:zinc transporter ZupT [Clostridium sp.]|uniref:zinc transporter ZupT n=1 Tax=Clostridium sp. TaxID=1506 RepID=UPI001D4C3FF3|nr:zinc transporter ZupT [Clostridium sp.]MBS5937227.1 zinc transporter ZupT [Clostridium sp.]